MNIEKIVAKNSTTSPKEEHVIEFIYWLMLTSLPEWSGSDINQNQ